MRVQKDNVLIEKRLTENILVLDGAMGTMIQKYGLTEEDFRGVQFCGSKKLLKGNNDILSITRPDVIEEIHRKYLESGADIIETNSFNTTSISMSEYGLEKHVYDIAYASAKIARKAADDITAENPLKPRFVAGVLGPTGKTASISPDVNNPGYRECYFDDFVRAYKESAKALIDGGVDTILIETVFDTLNCKAAIYAVLSLFEELKISLPLMISATIADISGRTLSGQTAEAFWVSVSHAPLLSIGLNCALGPDQIYPHIKVLSENASTYVSCHPNAGLPDEFGRYKQTPEIMAEKIKAFAQEGLLNIVGGCCGTTPDHIKAIAQAVEGIKPRQIPNSKTFCRLSGLEVFDIRPDSNFVNIGERTNVAGSKKFADLIKEKKYEEALSIARHQIENGAQVIDVNMDDAMLNSEHEMKTFLNLVASEPEISRVPIMIDSSKWSVIFEGLKCLQGKGIVNSISLKEGESEFKNKAREIQKCGAAVIVMAFDEQGQADTYERKVSICKRAYKILTEELKYIPQNIIFDPAILAIATGMEEHNEYASDYIRAVETIKKECPGCLISGGVSNLSFSFRGNNTVREMLHSVFLFHAIKAGMDMGIVNAGQLIPYEDIAEDTLKIVEDVILNRTSDATDKLIEKAVTLKKDSSALRVHKCDSIWRDASVEERISHAVVKGVTDFIEVDVDEAKKKYTSPISIIEGPLMDGIKHVGELFGAGKMFLPQVIKSARVMKKAVEHLTPLIEQEKLDNLSLKASGKILMATVKGDVHDIGKNIVNVVLKCNSYEIIDLGVMVACENIIKTAIQEKVDMIGLSGLITPSLDEMTHVAKEMEKAGLKIPLLVGGATTSTVHTAVKIAPVYSGPVVHVKDASVSVNVVKSLTNECSSDYADKMRAGYKKIAEDYESALQGKELLPFSQARERKFVTDWKKIQIVKPDFIGTKVLVDYPLDKLIAHIDWTYFFHVWELKGKFPQILEDANYGNAARKLYDDAREMLSYLVKNKKLKANAVFGIYPANSRGEDIIVYSNETKKQQLAVFHTLRQQTKGQDSDTCFSLADFIAPIDTGLTDYIGFFTATAGLGIRELEEELAKQSDDYRIIMAKALADRLAEAFSEHLNSLISKEYWKGRKSNSSGFEGIRPAIGYPSLPDHSEKVTLFELLNARRNIEVKLTENYAMSPVSSVCGLYFAHEKSKYFSVGRINKDQIEDYSKRKNIAVENAEKLLPENLAY